MNGWFTSPYVVPAACGLVGVVIGFALRDIVGGEGEQAPGLQAAWATAIGTFVAIGFAAVTFYVDRRKKDAEMEIVRKARARRVLRKMKRIIMENFKLGTMIKDGCKDEEECRAAIDDMARQCCVIGDHIESLGILVDTFPELHESHESLMKTANDVVRAILTSSQDAVAVDKECVKNAERQAIFLMKAVDCFRGAVKGFAFE